MADVLITNLPPNYSPAASGVIPYVQSGTTSKTTLGSLSAAMNIGTNATGNRYVSSSDPSAGSSGDLWFKV